MDAIHILLVEDSQDLADLLSRNLKQNGYVVTIASDGLEGLALGASTNIDLIVLDTMLPKMSGFDVCSSLRKQGVTTPILILSARVEDVDKVVGLDSGADDYLTKPFSTAELLARIRALLRRQNKSEMTRSSSDSLVIGDLQIDCMRRRVVREGAEIDLTANEFDLLLFLAQNAGRPFTRDQLLENVWECSQMVTEHSVNTMIRRIRLKLEPDPSNPTYLLTARGVGYRFVEEHDLIDAHSQGKPRLDFDQ